MALALDLRVDGVTSVVRALDAFGLDVEDPRAMDALAPEVARVVAEEAPRRTGRLAASTSAETTRARASAVLLAPYAGVINYGWDRHNIAPAGFIQRADDRLQPIALQRVENDLNQAIRQRGLDR